MKKAVLHFVLTFMIVLGIGIVIGILAMIYAKKRKTIEDTLT